VLIAQAILLLGHKVAGATDYSAHALTTAGVGNKSRRLMWRVADCLVC